MDPNVGSSGDPRLLHGVVHHAARLDAPVIKIWVVRRRWMLLEKHGAATLNFISQNSKHTFHNDAICASAVVPYTKNLGQGGVSGGTPEFALPWTSPDVRATCYSRREVPIMSGRG